MTDQICANCRHEIWVDDPFICSLCDAVYHKTCVGTGILDAADVQIAGCDRCAHDEQKRKVTNNSANMHTDSHNLVFQAATPNSQLTRPSVFSSDVNPSIQTAPTTVEMLKTGDTNAPVLIDSATFKTMVGQLKLLPSLITNVQTLIQKVDDLGNVKEDLMAIRTKLDEFTGLSTANKAAIDSLEPRVCKLQQRDRNVKRDFEFSIFRASELAVMGLSTELLKNQLETVSNLKSPLSRGILL